MRQTRNFSAYLTLRKDAVRKDGKSAIILRLKISGRKKDISLGEYCPPNDWDPDTARVKKSWPGYSKTNDIITGALLRAQEIIYKAKVNNQMLTIDSFDHAFGNASPESFISFIQAELVQEGIRSLRSEETMKTYTCELSKLKAFRSQILFNEFTDNFLIQYETYMRTKLKNKVNTINKSMRFLRNFNNRATLKGLSEQQPFRTYKIQIEKTNPTFLSPEQLKTLQAYYETTTRIKHKRTLGAYLFCCYTGLRHSDISRLRYKNIDGDSIYIKIQKTKDPLMLPLIPAAKQFIIPESHPELVVFRVPCNQAANRSLKEIAEKCNISKVLTFHTSRHTFATIGLNLGIPMEVIRDLLGHADIKQTQVYARVLEDTKRKQLEKWDNLFV